MTVRTLASCALLAALSVVFARLFSLIPSAYSRFSIEAVPVFLSGVLFGPLAGGLVGFTADSVGCLFSPFGYNPIFSVPPVLYGVCGGLFRRYLARKTSFGRVLLAFAPAAVLGSVLWQSFALTLVYFKDGPFLAGFLARLGARGIQFAVTAAVDALLLSLLFKTRILVRAGVWPPKLRADERKSDQ